MDAVARIEAAHCRGGTSWGYHSRASLEHRYVCMTVPKVGCTTVKRALHEFEGIAWSGDWEELHDQGVDLRLAAFSSSDVVRMLTSGAWLRFAFVRNPYDRLFSAWKSKIANWYDTEYRRLRDRLRAEYGYPEGQGGQKAIVAFRDFARHVLTTDDEHVRADGHSDLQTNILCYGLISYDVIGRFERFTEDFGAILRGLDAPDRVLGLAAEVTNATPQIPLAAAYDRELAGLVYDHYQPDFEAFGYEHDSWMFHDRRGTP